MEYTGSLEKPYTSGPINLNQSARFCTTDDGVRIAYATLGKRARERDIFHEVPWFLGDKRQLVSKVAVGRHARNWRALISQVHHTVEPYYVIAAVASLSISFGAEN